MITITPTDAQQLVNVLPVLSKISEQLAALQNQCGEPQCAEQQPTAPVSAEPQPAGDQQSPV